MGVPSIGEAVPEDVPGDIEVAAIGVDIGATSTRVAAFDGVDRLVVRRAIPTPRGSAAMVDAVAGLVGDVLDETLFDADVLDGAIVAVGILVPATHGAPA